MSHSSSLHCDEQGNETRMGKGKGTFEYWACRCVFSLLSLATSLTKRS